MSSMFKKKGGLAFKPKIPSARPRPAPAAPVPKAVDDPVAVDAASIPAIRETIETSKESDPSLTPGSVSRTADERFTEPLQTPRQSPLHEQTLPEDATSKETPQSSSNPPSQSVTFNDGIQDHVAIDPSLAQPSVEKPVNRTSSEPNLTGPVSGGTPTPRIQSQTPAEGGGPGGSISTASGSALPTQTGRGDSTISQPPDSSAATTPAPPKATPTSRPRAKRQASAPITTGGETDGAKPRKRQRKTAQDGDEATQPRPRQQRNTSDPQIRRRRARSLTPEDAENQVVDLQKLTMSDLTKDLHIGKKFSRHDELRERERKSRMKVKSGKESDQAEGEGGSGTEGIKAKSATPTAPSTPSAAPAAGPQFRIVDGQIIVDQSSLVMDRHARAAAAQAGQDIETIEENDFTRLTTSSSFMNTSKLKGPNIWTDEETELFYYGLQMFGTDFEIISKMFAGKQRRHVKLKYNREERHNPTRIDAAVKGEKTVKMDINEYKMATGSVFEPVEDIEAEQRKIAEDYEAERKRVADEQEEIMRKKREELFADEDEAGGKKKKGGKRKGKQAVAYGLNGEPISTEA
ncbi:transcription factor tfiiib component [Paramyrothecium foliicola]|nr:transcription factor tfiiib component [Paramyrothecium foliicola]